MTPEDIILFRADPAFAAKLGIHPPACARCQGPIKDPPTDWDGATTLVHAATVSCDLTREVWQIPKPEPYPVTAGLIQANTITVAEIAANTITGL